MGCVPQCMSQSACFQRPVLHKPLVTMESAGRWNSRDVGTREGAPEGGRVSGLPAGCFHEKHLWFSDAISYYHNRLRGRYYHICHTGEGTGM